MAPVPVDAALLQALTAGADADGITKHVVGAVLADPTGRVLLLHRPEDEYLGGLWELPSGGVEPGETLTAALDREVAEETGLTITGISSYLGHFDYLSGSGRRTRQFNFAATVAGSEVRLTEHDFHEWAGTTGQHKTSEAVQTVLAAWHQLAA
ncbi:NUDIX domain-containing protein [Streptomyces sp. WMMC500]|nr:NUDIX domain-containing protein [Streptomyces sp. WMMC500]WBB64545.1 NUDIX domain-containing protein [Streptomyces sp. WMMC500]